MAVFAVLYAAALFGIMCLDERRQQLLALSLWAALGAAVILPLSNP